MNVRASEHTEKNGTKVQLSGDGNIQSRLGVRTYLKGKSASDDNKAHQFEPFVEVNWIHNTRSWGVKMDNTALSQDGATNIAEVKTGVQGKLSDNLNVWGNVGVQAGDKGYSDARQCWVLNIYSNHTVAGGDLLPPQGCHNEFCNEIFCC